MATQTLPPDLRPSPAPAAAPASRRRAETVLLVVAVVAVVTFFVLTAHNGLAHDPRIANPTPGVSGRRPLWGVADWPAVFTRLFIGVAVVLGGGLAYRSWRARHMSTALVVFLAATGLCWLDPFGNWATYTVYDPRFTHFPTSWHWFSLAPGIEPVMAIPGYPFYWVPPALFAAWLYRRHVAPRRHTDHPLVASFVIGFATGFVFDAVLELFMIRAQMYSYTQYWGPAIHWDWVRLPVAVIALDASVFATITVLLHTDDRGRSVGQRVAERVGLLSTRPVLARFLAGWAILSLAASLFLAPFALMRAVDGASHVNAPWRYPQLKVFDPNGRWARTGIAGPFSH